MANKITVTKEGLKNLQDELNDRKVNKRNEIKEAISIARGFGDLSENSEYDEAREAQSRNEIRISELEEMLKYVQVVDDAEINGNFVSLGKSVKVKNLKSGKECEYHIVGPTETDPFAGRISDRSPIGEALIGKVAGDKVAAATINGDVKLEILDIRKT